MKTDRNGCSTCPPGAERWEAFKASWAPRGDRGRVQYDFRAPNGKLFTCVARSLDEARARRDAWLAEQAGRL